MTHHHDLIRRMADELDHYRQLVTDDRREVHPLAVEARAALSQPEPEVAGPTDEEVEVWADQQGFIRGHGDHPCGFWIDDGDAGAFARAVLARWGRPAPAPAGERQAAQVPVAVSGWQPIDTAPKDGTEILASDYDAVEIVSWRVYEAGSDWESRWGEVMFPAWWQPLDDHPDLPVPGGEVEDA